MVEVFCVNTVDAYPLKICKNLVIMILNFLLYLAQEIDFMPFFIISHCMF